MIGNGYVFYPYYQALQVNLATGMMTLLDDDSGDWYCRSNYAGAAEVDQARLYSVDTYGAAFEENYYGAAHPYDAVTVQDVIDGTYVLTPFTITKVGAFGANMLGEVIRFKGHTTASIDGLARVILEATADEIEFRMLPNTPAAGDEFIIGAVRFRVRFAPLPGKMGNSVKTLDGFRVTALPGDRNVDNEVWPDPPTAKITTRCYRDHHDVAGDDNDAEIEIFDEGDTGETTLDRISSLDGQGASLQVELECTDARTQVRFASIEARVREEAPEWTDASTTA